MASLTQLTGCAGYAFINICFVIVHIVQAYRILVGNLKERRNLEFSCGWKYNVQMGLREAEHLWEECIHVLGRG